MCYHEWQKRVCDVLRNGIERAQPTGSTIKPTGIVSFSVELMKQLLESAPKRED